ncbi:MAG: primosomal protein N', partial [Candidatus Veblenbacteria bacterium]|nr:primosomal protein N' [Candidatus Veblenbacteria bacterium]
QLKLLTWLAEVSGVSLATAVKLMVPVLPNRRFAIPVLERLPRTRPRIAPGQNIINLVTAELEASNGAVTELVARVVTRGQQVLVLVPEAHQVISWVNLFKPNYSCLAFSAHAPEAERRGTYLAVRAGQVQVVVGTRAALWLNFSCLGGIVVTESESENYRQTDQNPRYDALGAARQLARVTGVSLAQVSVAPPLDRWAAAQQRQEQWRELGKRAHTVELVNLQAAPGGKKHTLLSPELQEAVQQSLAQGRQVLLYLNRRGDATTALCRDCGYVASCEQCQRNLAWVERERQLVCYHCVRTYPPAVPCPRCGSVNATYRGSGLTRLAREVNELWPQVPSVLLEGEFKPEHTREAAQARVVVGSRTAVRAVNGRRLGVAGLVMADSELLLPEFRAGERTWQLAHLLAAQTRHVVVQTYQPEHYVWQSLSQHKPELFYQPELAMRQQYRWPPAVELVRFTCRSTSESSAREQALELRQKLQPHLPPQAEAVGPYPDYYRMRRGRYQYHLLLKYPPSFQVSTLWPYVPEDVVIEPDPLVILS